MKDSLIRKEDALDAAIKADMENHNGILSEKRARAFEEHIAILPPVQPTQTNCEYCHTDRDGYVLPLEKNCHAYISLGMNGWVIELKAKGWRGEAKIKYCPICGRRLANGTN